MKIRITGKKLPKAQWGNTGLFQMGQSLQNAMKLKQNPLYDPNNPAVQNLTGSARFPTGSISRFGPMSLNLGPEQYALTQGSDGILDTRRFSFRDHLRQSRRVWSIWNRHRLLVFVVSP